MSDRHVKNLITSDQEKTGSYRWVVYGLFVVCNTFGFLVANTIGILLPSITEDLSLSPTQQGMLSSAPYWANVVLMIIIALWVSQFAPKMLALVTVLLGGVLALMQAWSQSFIAIFIARLLFGVTMIAREPARALLIRQWIPQNQVNHAGGISNLFFGIMVSGGVLMMPVLLNYFGGNWRNVMITFACIFFALAAIWGIFGKENPIGQESSEESTNEIEIFKRVLGFKDVWFAGVGFMGALMSFASFNSFLPTLFVDFYDISLSKSGLIIALYILPGGFSGLAFGLLSKSSTSRSAILMGSGTIISMSFLSMTLVDTYFILIGIAIINGIAWGFFPLLFMVPFHIKNIRPREIAVSSATVMTMAAVGSSIGPTLTGFLQESSGSLEISLRFMAFSPLTLFIAGFLLRKTPQSN
ncbi:MAG: MFS transporter [Chloroflexota bacterium]|nr:MFS transporter [Chloroflexota bacterium]MED6296371.1 MFS transporter [Chloroflexota bacterium]